MTINDDRSDPFQRLGELVYSSWKGDVVQVPDAWIPSSNVWWIKKSARIERFYENAIRSIQRCTLTSGNSLKKTLSTLKSTGVVTESQRRNMKNSVKAVLRTNTLALMELTLLSMAPLGVAAIAGLILPLLVIRPWAVAVAFGALISLLTLIFIFGYNGLVGVTRNSNAFRRGLLVLYLIVGINGLLTLLTLEDDAASFQAVSGLMSASVGIYLLVSVLANTFLSFRLRRRDGHLWNDRLIYHLLNIIHICIEHADFWDTPKVRTTARENLDQFGTLIARHLARTVSGGLPGGRAAARKFALSAAGAVTELKAQLMRADGRTIVLSSAEQYLLTLLRSEWLELPTSEPETVRRRSVTETVRMLLGAGAAVLLIWILQQFGAVPSEYSSWVWGAVLMYAAFTIISAIDPRLDERLQAFLKIGSSVRALREDRADQE